MLLLHHQHQQQPGLFTKDRLSQWIHVDTKFCSYHLLPQHKILIHQSRQCFSILQPSKCWSLWEALFIFSLLWCLMWKLTQATHFIHSTADSIVLVPNGGIVNVKFKWPCNKQQTLEMKPLSAGLDSTTLVMLRKRQENIFVPGPHFSQQHVESLWSTIVFLIGMKWLTKLHVKLFLIHFSHQYLGNSNLFSFYANARHSLNSTGERVHSFPAECGVVLPPKRLAFLSPPSWKSFALLMLPEFLLRLSWCECFLKLGFVLFFWHSTYPHRKHSLPVLR